MVFMVSTMISIKAGYLWCAAAHKISLPSLYLQVGFCNWVLPYGTAVYYTIGSCIWKKLSKPWFHVNWTESDTNIIISNTSEN